jgi:hypothetical protein
MFGRLTDLINNVNKLNEDKILVNIISVDNIERYVLDLNRIDQIFEEGVTSFGDPLPVYAKQTEGIARDRVFTVQNELGSTLSKEKKHGDRYHLFASGEMYNSFDVVVDNGSFSITADTLKIDKDGDEVDYEKRYKILGLTDISKSKLSQRILPMVVREVRNILLS